MEQEFPVPGYENYYVTKDGEVISYARNKRRVMKPRQVGGKSQQGRTGIYLGRGNQFLTNRIVCAAKYGRWPEPWECVRHIDGDRQNNAMSNLEMGDFIMNAIDDIENGTRTTSPEYIDKAIQRLKVLKELL